MQGARPYRRLPGNGCTPECCLHAASGTSCWMAPARQRMQPSACGPCRCWTCTSEAMSHQGSGFNLACCSAAAWCNAFSAGARSHAPLMPLDPKAGGQLQLHCVTRRPQAASRPAKGSLLSSRLLLQRAVQGGGGPGERQLQPSVPSAGAPGWVRVRHQALHTAPARRDLTPPVGAGMAPPPCPLMQSQLPAWPGPNMQSTCGIASAAPC